MIFHDFGVPHHRGGCWGQGGGDPQGVYPILEGGDIFRLRIWEREHLIAFLTDTSLMNG